MTSTSIQHRDFYVYALFRTDGSPFYIGKGRGNRINIHEREAARGTTHKDHIIKALWLDGVYNIPKAKLIEGLADIEAKLIEVDLIHLIGRWPRGPLANLTKGGDGVANLAEESRARKSRANVLAWQNVGVREKRILGIKARWTEERRKQHSIAWHQNATPERIERLTTHLRDLQKRPGVIETIKNRNLDPDVRARRSAAARAIWQNPAHRKARSAASRAWQNKPESKERRREIAHQIWANPKTRAALSESRKLYWKNNPPSPERLQQLVAAITSPKSRAKSQATNQLPEVRARRIAAQKAAFSTPEAKAKRSAASKAMWAEKKGQKALPLPNPSDPDQPPPKHPKSPTSPNPSLP